MKVENIDCTKDNTCKCGSWLQHWKNYSDDSASHCSASGCENPMEVGVNVQKADSHDRDWYIVPFCEAHSHTTYHVDLVFTTKLVPANTSETCGK